jgi:hypothetical protein
MQTIADLLRVGRVDHVVLPQSQPLVAGVVQIDLVAYNMRIFIAWSKFSTTIPIKTVWENAIDINISV